MTINDLRSIANRVMTEPSSAIGGLFGPAGSGKSDTDGHKRVALDRRGDADGLRVDMVE